MKNSFLCTILVIALFTNVNAHDQDIYEIHQHLTRQAFQLLTKYFPQMANSEMAQYIGNSERNDNCDGRISWGSGTVVSGSWIEDEYDIVYHYGIPNIPIFNQGIAEYVFGSGLVSSEKIRKTFSSVSHFWRADWGQNAVTELSDQSTYGYWSYTIPENALQKMYKYLNGDYDNRLVFDQSNLFDGTNCLFWTTQLDFRMRNLFDLYRTGNTVKINSVRYLDQNDGYQNTNCVSWYLPKDRVYTILGRMCHLLEDMSVPAHVHCNSHANDKGMYGDYYELNEYAYHMYTADELFNCHQGIIDPYNSWGDPIYYLMYFLNQATDHFASGLTDGNDVYDHTCPELENIMSTLSLPTTTAQVQDINLRDQYCRAMHDKLMPLAIRATAGLLYWFAVETGQITKPTSSGTLQSNEVWGYNNLSGNIYVPYPYTLKIPSGSTIDLKGYSIISTGGTIIIESGSNIACTYTEQNGKITTVYSTIQAAMNSAISGQDVVIHDGNYIIENDLTVPSGINLIINPGQLTFNLGKQLVVNGRLEAVGVTFTSPAGTNWNGIKFINADNTSRIENSNILNFGPGYGADGIYIEGCNPTIVYNTINGTYNGIKIYNASPVIEGNTISGCTNGNGITIENCSKPYIGGNHINNVYYHGISAYNNWNYGDQEAGIWINNNSINNSSINSYSGIRSYNSLLIAYENFISNFNMGFYAESNSIMDFGLDFGSNYFYYHGGNNEVHGCGSGLVANNSSILATGFFSESDVWGGYCKIEGYSRYSIYAANHGEVQAEFNSWGPGIYELTPYCDATSYVTWDPIWDFRYSLAKTTASASFINNDEGSSVLKALLMIKERKYSEAKGILKAIIDKGSNIALIHLSNLFFRSKDNDIVTYLEQKFSKVSITDNVNPYKKTLLKLYHGVGEFDKVLSLADELIKKGDKEAKIDKFLVYALDLADNDKALSILKEIESDLGKERSDELYTLLLPAEHNLNAKEQNKIRFSAKNIELQPTEFLLAQNYPNPFNPATTINYSIPENTYVQLKVYDTIGKEVEVLVDEIKEPGNYQVTFNASKLTSGIYFYTIKAGDFVSTKKLIVLK